MSEEKKMTEEKKITEETKLYEEKKAVDPFIAGFYESMAKTNTEKITKEIMEGCLKILMTVIVIVWRVEMKILKIGPGDQAIPSSENRPLNKAILTP
jgi:hypothetical protein